MNRPFWILALLLFATVAIAQDVPSLAPQAAPALADRAALVTELQRTEKHFLDSIEGLTEEQWNYKAGEDRWSIAQCAEHIAAAEPFIRNMIAGVIAKPLAADVLASAHKDEMLKTALVDRSKKFKAPEPLIPTNRFGSPAAAIEAFTKERAATIALAGGEADLRAQGGDHFLLGPLDAYGWFLFLSGHSERHTLQIEEVKASPGYPK